MLANFTAFNQKRTYTKLLHPIKGYKLLIPFILLIGVGCKIFRKSTKTESYRTGQIEIRKFKSDWFNEEYDRYKPEQTVLDSLESLKSFDLIIFGGEWCSDTKRELPRTIKILNVLKYPENQLKIILLDQEKKCSNCLNFTPEKFNVKFVPTIIILKNGIEIGRIVENPFVSLERDLLKIINQP